MIVNPVMNYCMLYFAKEALKIEKLYTVVGLTVFFLQIAETISRPFV